jgi:hypothetical protein
MTNGKTSSEAARGEREQELAVLYLMKGIGYTSSHTLQSTRAGSDLLRKYMLASLADFHAVRGR